MWARMNKGDDGKMVIEIIDSCLLPTDSPSADQNLQEIYLQAGKALADKGFIVMGPWHYLEGEGHRAPLYPPETASTPHAAPSEADEMLAISQTLALRALKEVDKAKAEASVGGKDPRRNHNYMRLAAALDAHCEQLAHLLWTRKHYAAGHGPLNSYPSAHEALKYLRELANKESK